MTSSSLILYTIKGWPDNHLFLAAILQLHKALRVFLMFVPNAERAMVDIRKLRDYCLNPLHDDGKHKARLFWAILGMTAADAEDLQRILLEAIQTTPAQLGRQDAFGQRYTVDVLVKWQGKQAMVRSGWIVEHHADMPKLTSCYPV